MLGAGSVYWPSSIATRPLVMTWVGQPPTHLVASTIGPGDRANPVAPSASYAARHRRAVRIGTPTSAAARLSGTPSCR